MLPYERHFPSLLLPDYRADSIYGLLYFIISRRLISDTVGGSRAPMTRSSFFTGAAADGHISFARCHATALRRASLLSGAAGDARRHFASFGVPISPAGSNADVGFGDDDYAADADVPVMTHATASTAYFSLHFDYTGRGGLLFHAMRAISICRLLMWGARVVSSGWCHFSAGVAFEAAGAR